jgi:hypothetical protein
MSDFDFIDAAGHGFRNAWADRIALARAAVMPFAIKWICLVAVYFFGMEENFLRQGLVMMPAFFVEGWFLAYALRYVYLGEAWPNVLTGDVAQDLVIETRRRFHMLSATIIYVLIKLVSAVMTGMALQSSAVVEGMDKDQVAESVPFGGEFPFFLIAIVVGAVLIWTFRYVWLYVPQAMGYGVRDFLRRIFGFAASFKLLATWMVCFTPLFIVLLVVQDGVKYLFPGSSYEDPVMLHIIAMGGVQSGIELVMLAVTSLAIGDAVLQVMKGRKQ